MRRRAALGRRVMGVGRSRAPLGGWALVLVAALAVACGSSLTEERLDASGQATEQDPVLPDAVREIPVGESLWGVALGADEVLGHTGLQPGSEPSFLVVDVVSGGRSSVAAPPEAGTGSVSLAPFGDDALAFTRRCPEYSDQDLEKEGGSKCSSGFDGIEIDLFDKGTREWIEVGLFDPSELGLADPTQLSYRQLGVSGDNLYLAVSSGQRVNVVRIDIPSRRVTVIDPTPPEAALVSCVTGSGHLVGALSSGVDEDSMVLADEPLDPEVSPVVVLAPDAGDWSVREEVTIKAAFQQLVCGADTFAVVGTEQEVAAPTTWREFLPEGALVNERVLSLPVTEAPVTDLFFGQGTDHLGFVREYSPSESIKTGPDILDFDTQFFRTVILVPGPDNEPMSIHDRDESSGSTDAIALTNGAVVVFDRLGTESRLIVAD